MASDNPRIDDIYLAALEKAEGEERGAYLDEFCGRDTALRARVDRLLGVQPKVGSFLESPAPGINISPTLDLPITEKPGTQIGPYKLLQQIGEGGMGTVFMAEQTIPVERRVALKVIKPGMDTRQVIARFEAERQALAMMDHPNIAKVMDAGTTGTGRPYFVMELVKGLPITQYCDERYLSPRERLELFVPICQAVQHAHQKGIVHRDLKPSNILVARYDDKPVPKVIDFGVAKATSQKLTEKTMFTQYGQLVGTVEYMSPEQAQFNQLDVDTRSDIYSLGVLLYELLTGETPFDRTRLRSAAFEELLRIIREEEPPRPSVKLSTGQALASVAANRHMEPHKLGRFVRGELDWIVMKALEKERSRRYETANGFAMDVERYLADEPVLACPPSAGYRLRKFARRNKGGLAVAALVLFFLVLMGSGIGWAVRDRAARDAEAVRQQGERQAKAGGQIESIFSEVDRLEGEQNWPEALDAARRAEAVVAGGEVDSETTERVHARLRDLEFVDRLEGVRMLMAIWVGGKFDDAKADPEYARAFREYGVDVEALAVQTAVERLRVRPALAIPVAAALDDWAQVRWSLRRDGTASKRLVAVARGIDPHVLRDQMRAMWGKSATEVGDETRRLAESIDVRAEHPVTLGILAGRLWRMEQPDHAVRLLRDAQHAHPSDFFLNYNLAHRLSDQEDDEGAVRFYTAAVSVRPRATAALNNLGIILRRQKKLDEAIAAYRRALEIDPNFAYAHNGLGIALQDMGELDDAITHFRRAIELDPKSSYAHVSLGKALRDMGELDDAIAHYRTAIELDPKRPDSHFHCHLGSALGAKGELDEAVAHYHTAIELDPRNAAAHGGLGLTLAIQGKFAEAIPHYRRAIELDPKRAATHFLLGYALARRGELDEAIDHFRTSLELDPRSADAHKELGIALKRNGDIGEAITVLRRAVELDPKNAGAHEVLGIALAAQDKLDEAITHDRKALELDPKRPVTHFFLGVALAAQGELDKAVAHYRTAIELDPKFVEAHNNLGALLCDALGEYDQAIESFQKAIELDPDFAGASNNLRFAQGMKSWGLVSSPDPKLRDPERAIEAVKRGVERDPRSAGAWQFLGWVRYRLGDWRASVDALEESCRLEDGGECAQWIVLALAHAKLAAQEGLPDKAREHHRTEARRRYEQADKQIDSRWRARPRGGTFQAIWDFRVEARDLLGVKESKN